MSTFSLRRRLGAAVATVAAGVGVLTAGGTLAAAPASAESSPQAVPCNVVPIFETDGFLLGHSMLTYRGQTGNGFNSHVPGGYAAVPIEYTDGVFPVPGIVPGLDESSANGIGLLDGAVRSYHARCPGSRIIITGFSEGAVVAGNEIENLSRTNVIPHNLIRGVLYGDPRRPFGDGGRGGVAGGIETNVPSLVPGITMQGPHQFGDIAVHELCNENDGICNSTNIITNAAAFANGLQGYFAGRAHGYNIDPVRDQNPGTNLFPQNPLIAYGPPIATGVGTPWQIQNTIGQFFGASAFHSAIGAALALVPQPIKDAAAADPWFQVINS